VRLDLRTTNLHEYVRSKRMAEENRLWGPSAFAGSANAICERFLGSVRCECLDHLLVLDERHLLDVLVEYCRYFNESRPHQGIGQLVPIGALSAARGNGSVVAIPFLNGLHHDYRRAA